MLLLSLKYRTSPPTSFTRKTTDTHDGKRKRKGSVLLTPSLGKTLVVSSTSRDKERSSVGVPRVSHLVSVGLPEGLTLHFSEDVRRRGGLPSGTCSSQVLDR